MTLKNRLKAYLKKRGEPVSHEELVRVVKKAGIKSKQLTDILWNMEEPDVGSWYGYPFDSYKNKGKKEKWYRYYEITEKQRRQWYADRKWFDTLK